MSEPLVVKLPHKLGKEEALRRIKPALGKASSSFPMLVVEEAWSGDRMTFRVRALAQLAAGSVDVADDHVQLEVTLPWLLHKFAQVVQQTIAGRGRIHLEKNNSSARLAAAAPPRRVKTSAVSVHARLMQGSARR
jgi:Putative polyhydroxyalkanoic acid system protein (PHA_gran_rgn)